MDLFLSLFFPGNFLPKCWREGGIHFEKIFFWSSSFYFFIYFSVLFSSVLVFWCEVRKVCLRDDDSMLRRTELNCKCSCVCVYLLHSSIETIEYYSTLINERRDIEEKKTIMTNIIKFPFLILLRRKNITKIVICVKSKKWLFWRK